MSPSGVQCLNSRNCRRGSDSRVGVAIRARRTLLDLLMEQGIEDLVDHAEVVLLILELPLQVNQIGRNAVQFLGKEPCKFVGNSRM